MTAKLPLKSSNGEYQINDVIQGYNLVLGDTSFLDANGNNLSLGRELYDIKTLQQLAPLHDHLKRTQFRINWQSMNVAAKPNVYTTKKVVAEIGRFEEILEQTVTWLQNSERKKIVGKLRKKSKKSGREWRRANQKSARISQELRTDDMDLQRGNDAFNYLDALLHDIKGMRNSIKVYQGPTIPLSRTMPGISATDYGLVEAALGYVLANEGTKVAILSNDIDVTVALGEHQARNYFKNIALKVDVFYHQDHYSVRKASPLEKFLVECSRNKNRQGKS